MSPHDQLPRSALSFLRTHVDHVVKLRFLLFLHSAPNGTSTIGSAARALQVSKRQVRDMADELAGDRLLRVTDETLELAPASIEDRLAIADLADSYSQDRNLVLDALRALGRFAS